MLAIHDYRRPSRSRADGKTCWRPRHGFQAIAQSGGGQSHFLACFFGAAGLAALTVAGQHAAGAAVDDFHDHGVGFVALGHARSDEVARGQDTGHGRVAGSILAGGQGLVRSRQLLLHVAAAQHLEARGRQPLHQALREEILKSLGDPALEFQARDGHALRAGGRGLGTGRWGGGENGAQAQKQAMSGWHGPVILQRNGSDLHTN